jgi:hypothetical protein
VAFVAAAVGSSRSSGLWTSIASRVVRTIPYWRPQSMD